MRLLCLAPFVFALCVDRTIGDDAVDGMLGYLKSAIWGLKKATRKQFAASVANYDAEDLFESGTNGAAFGAGISSPSVLAVPTPIPTTRPSSRPTAIPTPLPTRAPVAPPVTARPSSHSSATLCPAYTATNTNSDTQNYATCGVIACGGTTITASGCTALGGACTGDQYMQLAYLNGSLIPGAYNDDYCGLCSQVTWTVPANYPCQEYVVYEGCYSAGACTGSVSIASSAVTLAPAPAYVVAGPTLFPSRNPTRPTAIPSPSPTILTSYCPYYAGTNTKSDTQFYSVCGVYACGGATITASGCVANGGVCTGDQYLRLSNYYMNTTLTSNDDYCGLCSQLTYSTPVTAACSTYVIEEGCYSTGACSGIIAVTGGNIVVVPTRSPTSMPSRPTAIPTVVPTQPTAIPTPAPTQPTAIPTPAPTQPTYTPTCAPSIYPAYATARPSTHSVVTLCPAYTATNTNSDTQNYATCGVIACGGTTITASGCTALGGSCTGDQYLQLAYLNGSLIPGAYNDDYCGLCSQVTWTVPANYPCQEYVVYEGCYSTGACTGSVSIASSAVTLAPAPSFRSSSAAPTLSVAPTPQPLPPHTPGTPTYQPTSPMVVMYVMQAFSGISVSQYNSEPNSAVTIQQTVALSIGYNVLATNVNVVSVSSTSSSTISSITIGYTVTATSTQFANSQQAYNAYSNALITSTTTGAFTSNLHTQATNNGATYLAATTAAPVTATSITNELNTPPSIAPTPFTLVINAKLSAGGVAGIVITILLCCGVGGFVAYRLSIGGFGSDKDVTIESSTSTTVEMSSTNPMGQTEQRL